MSAPTIPTARGDRRLALAAAAVIAVSVLVVIARALKLLPAAVATGVVLGGVLIGLRILMIFSARSAGTATRARVLTIVATVGLAISAVTVVASLPHLTSTGGTGKFVGDLAAHLWCVALLLLAAATVRTTGWRVLLGIGFAGFLGVSALARFVGTPLVNHLGVNSLFATAVYVPVTEELLKALPVVVIVFFALRRREARPSALDAALLGAVSGAGFALYENALYGRGGAAWSVDAPFSLLLPTERKGSIGTETYIAGGHLVYTALIGLGIGITAYYRGRLRFAALAAPIAVIDVLAEHICGNALVLVNAQGKEPLVERILSPLTLGGRLSSILLVGGVAGMVWFERRITGRSPIRAWFLLAPAEAGRRAQALAAAQRSERPGAGHGATPPPGQWALSAPPPPEWAPSAPPPPEWAPPPTTWTAPPSTGAPR